MPQVFEITWLTDKLPPSYIAKINSSVYSILYRCVCMCIQSQFNHNKLYRWIFLDPQWSNISFLFHNTHHHELTFLFSLLGVNSKCWILFTHSFFVQIRLSFTNNGQYLNLWWFNLTRSVSTSKLRLNGYLHQKSKSTSKYAKLNRAEVVFIIVFPLIEHTLVCFYFHCVPSSYLDLFNSLDGSYTLYCK